MTLMPRHRRILFALMLTIFGLRVADTYTVFNETLDENLHVVAGLEYLEQHQMGIYLTQVLGNSPYMLWSSVARVAVPPTSDL